MQPNEHDPEATVWMAVAELEQKRFTRKEISVALRGAYQTLWDEHHGR